MRGSAVLGRFAHAVANAPHQRLEAPRSLDRQQAFLILLRRQVRRFGQLWERERDLLLGVNARRGCRCRGYRRLSLRLEAFRRTWLSPVRRRGRCGGGLCRGLCRCRCFCRAASPTFSCWAPCTNLRGRGPSRYCDGWRCHARRRGKGHRGRRRDGPSQRTNQPLPPRRDDLSALGPASLDLCGGELEGDLGDVNRGGLEEGEDRREFRDGGGRSSLLAWHRSDSFSSRKSKNVE